MSKKKPITLQPTVKRPKGTRLDYAEHKEVMEMPIENIHPSGRCVCMGCHKNYVDTDEAYCEECKKKIAKGEKFPYSDEV